MHPGVNNAVTVQSLSPALIGMPDVDRVVIKERIGTYQALRYAWIAGSCISSAKGESGG